MDNQLMFKNNDSKGSLIVILLRRLNCVFDSESTWDHSGSGTMFTFSTIAIIWAFMAGILLYILKLKFALKIWTAKTHVKVFNHSLALCLFVSGDDILYNSSTLLCHFLRDRHCDMCSSLNTASQRREKLWGRIFPKLNEWKFKIGPVLNVTTYLPWNLTKFGSQGMRVFILSRKLNFSLTDLNSHLSSISSIWIGGIEVGKHFFRKGTSYAA